MAQSRHLIYRSSFSSKCLLNGLFGVPRWQVLHCCCNSKYIKFYPPLMFWWLWRGGWAGFQLCWWWWWWWWVSFLTQKNLQLAFSLIGNHRVGNKTPSAPVWKWHSLALRQQEIKPVNPKGNQPWVFTGRTDAEAEALILWSPDGKRPWCWERVRVGGEGGSRGWDDWIVSPTQ